MKNESNLYSLKTKLYRLNYLLLLKPNHRISV